ncbi:MAG: hypothetical protein ACUVTH_03260, partial [Thermogutta sp.]
MAVAPKKADWQNNAKNLSESTTENLESYPVCLQMRQCRKVKPEGNPVFLCRHKIPEKIAGGVLDSRLLRALASLEPFALWNVEETAE